MAPQGGEELPGPELRASVRMYGATGHLAAASHRHGEGVDGQDGLHPVTDRVADDPARPDVLDGAQVELALAGVVLGDVGQPQPIRRLGAEVPPDQIVVGRRARLLAVLAALLAEHAPPLVVRADPPHPPVTAAVPGAAGLISEQAVAELGIVTMGVEHGIGQVRLLEVPVGDRVGEPAVVGLAGELEDPARHRHGDPVGGQLADERVHHFPGRFAWDR